jgi:hypothetical protein
MKGEQMKRIIDGKRYDTETAEQVTTIGSLPGTSRTDFRYWEATLYRTPKGRWFAVGNGGGMTMFAESVGGGGSRGGSGLIPISKTEARKHLEDDGNIDALEQWFAIEEA